MSQSWFWRGLSVFGLFIPSGGTGKFIVFPLAVAGKRMFRGTGRTTGCDAKTAKSAKRGLVWKEFPWLLWLGFWRGLSACAFAGF